MAECLVGLVDRLDKLPFVGGFFELVGLLVTGWFTYRYLTFAPDRCLSISLFYHCGPHHAAKQASECIIFFQP